MGSRSVFRIAYSFATLIGARLESCAKRIRERRYDASNMMMKDLTPTCDLNVMMKDLTPRAQT
jgi:hypothetical protein